MKETIDEGTVLEWAERAQLTLKKSQRLCTRAQTQMHSTTYQLTSVLPEKLDTSNTLVDSLKRQHNLLINITKTFKRKTQTLKTINDQYDKNLMLALDDLNSIVLQLQQTVVPGHFIDTDTTEKTLDEFISIDSIDLLKRNINIYKGNFNKMYAFLQSKLYELITEPMQKMVKKYSKTLKLYEEILLLTMEMKAAPAGASTINTILKENVSLENELVSILEMLTNHYDQCKAGVDFIRAGNSGVNLQVLQNDSLELPDVLKELNTLCDFIANNEIRAQKYYDSKVPPVESFIESSKGQLDLYREFKTKNIPTYMTLYQLCREIINKSNISEQKETPPLKEYSDTINQLVYHYKQFLDVYKTKYLVELHNELFTYPRKFLNKLSEFLNDDLYQLQNEEKERRKQWLAKYGDFIPKEFKLPGEYNQPTIVQIITEGLEQVQPTNTDSLTSDERQLLDLIKKMNVPNRLPDVT